MSDSPPSPATPDNGPGPAAEIQADPADSGEVKERPRKGPLSFLSGALTSGLLAWVSLQLSQRVVVYYALHPPQFSKPFAQSIATAMKTLVVGMSFLATFTFAFVGLGLLAVFVRSFTPAGRREAS
ncbi:MAG: DUF3082 domain-containing protein [Cyanobacteria bacterium]|nr:DUF3082 domain-containing protein [Cyanobacteria bacterium bin.51]